MSQQVECKGKEGKEFYNSPWGEDAFHEDSYVKVNGKTVSDDFDLSRDVKDEDTVTVVYGNLYGVEGYTDLGEYLGAWLKKRTTTTIVVEVAKEKEAAVRAAIESIGAKVI